MDFGIKDQLFVVTGATAGLGYAVLRSLLAEGAYTVAVGRNREKLRDIETEFRGKVHICAGDVTREETLSAIADTVGAAELSGLFVNAGGPPAGSFAETTLEAWDNAYQLLLRWKIDLVKRLLGSFLQQGYGRILFSESASVKQPVENLILSNSMRMAVVGLAKTLSEEYADKGITVNVIAPGMHETKAIERIFIKKSQKENISIEEARARVMQNVKVGRPGNPDDFASLATWLLSPLSNFVTGQTFALDGGSIKYSLG